MNRAEYVAAVGRSLDFLDGAARGEVLADIEELYDGLSGRGMDDADVQRRIGSPAAVAGEYRLVEELDRLDRSPAGAAGLRIGLATLTGRLARGAVFQLLGIVWLSLAVVALGAGVCMAGGLAFAAGVALGFEPFVTTIAVPGIPPVSGVMMGLAATAAAFALLLANRAVMRALSRFMRNRLLRRRDSAGPNTAAARGAVAPSRRRWIDSGRAAWQITALAVVLAALSAGLMLVVAAPAFPLVVDRTEEIPLEGVTAVDVRAVALDVRLEPGETAAARLTASLKRTFGQSVDLRVSAGGSTAAVEAVYREGLSWGINPRPLLVVTVPEDPRTEFVVRPERGATVDLRRLPGELGGRVTVAE